MQYSKNIHDAFSFTQDSGEIKRFSSYKEQATSGQSKKDDDQDNHRDAEEKDEEKAEYEYQDEEKEDEEFVMDHISTHRIYKNMKHKHANIGR